MGAAQQGMHRTSEGAGTDVEVGDLERGEHAHGALVRGRRPGQAVRVLGVRRADEPCDQQAQGGHVEGVHPDDLGGDRPQQLQVGRVGVGLAQSGDAVGRVHLHDRADRPRLVHADGVQQRRVGEGDGCEDDRRDGQRVPQMVRMRLHVRLRA